MSSRQEAIELYNKGLNYAKQERFAEAVQPLLEAIKIDPDYVNAYNLLGKIYIQEGDVEKAREYWMTTLKIDPFNSTAMACLEASYPKPLFGGIKNIARIAAFLVIFVGIAMILLQVNQIGNQVDKLSENGFVDVPIENGTENENVVNPPPEKVEVTEKQNGDPQTEKIDKPTTPEKIDKPIETPTTPEKIDKPITPETPLAEFPKSIEELETRYKTVVSDLVLKGKFEEALPELNALKQSKLEHRYAIGNSFYWSGYSNERLDLNADAISDYQNVTEKNSYKFKDAQRSITRLQSKQ